MYQEWRHHLLVVELIRMKQPRRETRGNILRIREVRRVQCPKVTEGNVP